MDTRGSDDFKKEVIAKRIAKEIKDGYVVNLGVGIPMLVTKHISKEIDVILQQENGILGMRAIAEGEIRNPTVIDAGCRCVGIIPGGMLFDAATSFGIIRGGHLDVTVLGVFEVDQSGSIANHKIPGGRNAGMGGAMDLANGAKKVIIATTHVKKNGKSTITKELSLPATAVNCADMIVTELAVIDVTEEGLILKEVASGYSVADIQGLTDAELITSNDLKVMPE